MKADVEPTGRDSHAAIAAAILLISLVGIGLSLSIPLLSLEMERMGVSGRAIGLNTAVAGIASIVVVPFVPRLAAAFGVGRLIALATITAAASFLAFKLFWSYEAWFAVRFVFAASLGTLFVLSEYWIAANAPPEKRGVIMGLYGTSLAIGFAAGPGLLGLVGTQGWPPYLAATGLYALALVPLWWARSKLPKLDSAPSHSLGRYLVAVPLATAAALGFGAVETGGFALLPVYGVRLGFDATTAAMLVSAMAFGNVVSQLPIGWLADRMDKGLLLMGLAGIGAAGSLLIPLVAPLGLWPLFALLFVWGGIVGGLYPVGLAHLASRFTGSDLAGANAAFVLLYNVGLTLGPPVVGFGLDAQPLWGFAAALAVFCLVVVSAGLWRR